MTLLKVKAALAEALEMLRKYNSEQMDKAGNAEDLIHKFEIEQTTRKLIKESHILGAAGNPCMCCNGTGRM